MKVFIKSSTLGDEEIGNVMLFWYEKEQTSYHARYVIKPEGDESITCEKIFPKWSVDKIELFDTGHPAIPSR